MRFLYHLLRYLNLPIRISKRCSESIKNIYRNGRKRIEKVFAIESVFDSVYEAMKHAKKYEERMNSDNEELMEFMGM